jgi:hypothetical protein
MGVSGDFRIPEQVRKTLLVDAEDFQLEKEGLLARRAPGLPHPGQKRLVGCGGAVGGKEKLGIEIGFQSTPLEGFIASEGGRQQIGRKVIRRDASPEIPAEGVGLLADLAQVLFQGRVVVAGIEAREIPAEVFLWGCGHKHSFCSIKREETLAARGARCQWKKTVRDGEEPHAFQAYC